MRIDTSLPPTNPYHIARAYGVTPGAARGISPGQPLTGPAPIQPVQDTTRVPSNTDRLIAGVVPGGVEFSAGGATGASPAAIPMYRHPADKNAAATAVNVGRKLDVQG